MNKYNKKDYINISIIIIFFFIFLFIILKDKSSIYGSMLDYVSQHYMIPEYFRTLFYETKEVFPSFALNLGMGQNIFNFSYYGLFNPVILISYLFPSANMAIFLMITSIIIIMVSIILFYKWISLHFENRTIRFITTFLFMTASPLILHSHRHIMFINYMPFLLMGLFGVNKYINENKKILLIISSILIILTSYFFSIPALLVLFLYSITLYLKKEEKIKFKQITKFIFKEILLFIIPVLITAFFLLPTLKAILNSRFGVAEELNILSYFVPNFTFDNLLYNSYSLGLTFIFIIAIVSALLNKEKYYKLLGVVFILIMIFPIINYMLNGLMYLNAKVYITFIPIAILLIGELFKNTIEKEINIKKILLITIIVTLLVCLSYEKNEYIKYIIKDIIFTTIILLLMLKTKKEQILIFLIIPSIILCYEININDKLGTLEIVENQYNKEIEKLTKITANDKNMYRTGDNTNIFYNSNNIRNINEYKTTMYSSLTNKYYKNFYWNEFNNENPNRNDAIFQSINNNLYNIYAGNKYIISSKEEDIIGYEKIDSINKFNLYKNDNVFTLGYSTDKLMSLREYKTLNYPYNVEALMNYTVVDQDIISDYQTDIKEIQIEKDNYNIELKENKTFNIKTKNTYKNKLIFIKFDMEYAQKCKDGDTYIRINDVTNKLTCRSWKYHNKNYSFEYVISSNNEISNLDIEMSKGKYIIKNIKVYELDYDKIKDINKLHSKFIIDKKTTKGDIINGKIQVKENGYFSMSVPYDEGFTIYMDNKKIKHEIVNTSFIGFEIEKGNHEIKIIYDSPWLKEGKILSAVGIIMFLSVIVVEKKRSKKYEKNINDCTLL